MTERDRAFWGANAVAAGTPDFNENDAETNLVDALANIMHFCHHHGLDFESALERADNHFTEESNDV